MRELLIASRHRFESMIKSRQAPTQTGQISLHPFGFSPIIF